MAVATIGVTGSGATYECDGTNDEVQWQAAVDAVAATTYDSIRVLTGVYWFSAGVEIKDNVSIEGDNEATCIIKLDTDFPILTDWMFYGTTTGDNFTMRYLTLDGNKAALTGSDTTHLVYI